MARHPLIAFEGPIAAGKTTLAALLAAHLEGDLVLEPFEGNEFLSDFYRDRERWSLAMQLSFLDMRREQMMEIPKPFSRTVVADYSQWKDGIFAGMLLRDRELRLFERLNRVGWGSATTPDILVYLDANNDVLLSRIRSRGRPYELSIDPSYLNSLREAYERATPIWRDTRVIRYDTSFLNLESGEQLNQFFHEITRRIAG
jgi:deoxyadenosine/deoxycytidine kinase